MAKSKINQEAIENLLEEFDMGETPANLAKIYNVSASTISRYLKKNGRKVEVREAHRVLISDKVKSKLRRILSGHGISNPDILISELDKHFLIEEREHEDYEIIYV